MRNVRICAELLALYDSWEVEVAYENYIEYLWWPNIFLFEYQQNNLQYHSPERGELSQLHALSLTSIVNQHASSIWAAREPETRGLPSGPRSLLLQRILYNVGTTQVKCEL